MWLGCLSGCGWNGWSECGVMRVGVVREGVVVIVMKIEIWRQIHLCSSLAASPYCVSQYVWSSHHHNDNLLSCCNGN